MPHNDYPLTLLCHPATPAPVVRSIEAQATIEPDGSLRLAYRVWGDMARLLIPEPPEPHTPERTDSLWEHSCFEAFVGVAGEHANPAYREFNFSSSGQWAAYAFSNYRQPDASLPMIAAPQISARAFAGRLELDASIAADALPPGARAYRIGLSAVIEAADVIDGSHSYWALCHTAERPDFHQRAAFILELANPRNAV